MKESSPPQTDALPRGSSLISLAGWVGLCLLAEVIAGVATGSSVRDWYPTLQKPDWTPPAWLFAPVWSALYVMMGVAMWVVRRAPDKSLAASLLFFIQLALNVFWTVLFFVFKSPGAALIEILALWVIIAWTALAFFRVRPLASILFIPYLLWVAFAAALNGSIWWLNG